MVASLRVYTQTEIIAEFNNLTMQPFNHLPDLLRQFDQHAIGALRVHEANQLIIGPFFGCFVQ